MTMKKILLVTVMAVCLMVTAASAAPSKKKGDQCSYSPLQDLIRNARSGKDLEPILGGRVDLNAPVKCGGTILQLAIRRGNPEVVKLLLENGVLVTEDVSLDSFYIEGAPDKIPLLMFAAYYSPRQDILNLIISAGADMTSVDSNGENVLWYLDKNPVLKNTTISDNIKNALLFNIRPINNTQNNNMGTAPVQPAQVIGGTPGQQMPMAQPSSQMIISKQPDGSIGVPAEIVKSITTPSAPIGVAEGQNGGVVQPSVQRPVEIVEPSLPIQ